MSITTQANNSTGFLRVRTAAAQDAVPVASVLIRVFAPGNPQPLYQASTDDTGVLEGIPLPCPPRALSLNENNTQMPYAIYDITTSREGFMPAALHGVQVFDGEIALAELELLPADMSGAPAQFNAVSDTVDIPSHSLYSGDGGSGFSPIEACPLPIILDEVVIPDTLIVHLGKPSASAQNVTVSFRNYIKNVASSEVYPTWPEQALRANIHAQISLALNRVYTEWYRSKGYNFQITNSTSYDQYYVHGRTIFDVMSRITDDIFNTYIRKTGTVNPFYAEYCDGKIVPNCPGMKQWGTVTQANQGKNALQILKVYYGNDIEIIRTDNIKAIPESYPGVPLRVGSTGIFVRILQRQLNRIARDYPFFGTVTVDGVFGTTTEAVVKKFQKQFSLPQDGIVGRATWYKISYIYVAVKKLAELKSEGEKPSGDLVAGQYPGMALRIGSRGNDVLQMQFWLNDVAQVTPGVPGLAADGIFGVGTQASVEAFQERFGLSIDGVVGKDTWDAIYREYTSLVTDETPDIIAPGQYPGTVLAPGSRGNDVKRMQFWLRIVARNNTAVPDLAADGIFGPGTERSVRAFQSFYRLPVDGLVGQQTWNKIYEVYTNLINNLMVPSARPGTYPGSPLRLGSSGQSVKEIQYYLYLLSAYYITLPVIAYDGVFGSATQTAVREWQQLNNLTVDGVIGAATWASIYNMFSTVRSIDGPVDGLRVFAYPGQPLVPGSEGSMVRFAQFMLSFIGAFFDTITPITTLTGIYDADTERTVRSFQTEFELPVTGVIDEATWNRMVVVYLTSASETSGQGAIPDGEYGGSVLVLGSTGLQVFRLQTYINGIAARYCVADFTPATGIFTVETLRAVQEFQLGFGLPVTGFVDRLTWDAIYNYYAGITGNSAEEC